MSIAIDIKKKEVELMRVQAAKAELELRVEEAAEQIARLTSGIDIQNERIAQLVLEIKELQERAKEVQ